MKHPVLLAAALALTIMAACTPAPRKARERAEDLRTRIELCRDPDSIRVMVEQAVAFAQVLADRGLTVEAATYLDNIQDALKTKSAGMLLYFDSAKATVANLPATRADSLTTRATGLLASTPAPADTIQ